MPSTTIGSGSIFVLTDNGKMFLGIVRMMLNSDDPDQYFRPGGGRVRCIDMVNAIDNIKDSQTSPSYYFSEIYIHLAKYIPKEIPLWKILHKDTTLEELKKEASMISSMLDAITLYLKSIDAKNTQPFYRWDDF